MDENKLSRRRFTALLAGSGSATLLASTVAVAADDPAGGKGVAAKAASGEGPFKEPASPPPTPPDKPNEKPASAEPTGAPTAAEHALRILLARFPDERLDAQAQVSLLIDLERHMARSRALASTPLDNGDEPGFQFAAYRT